MPHEVNLESVEADGDESPDPLDDVEALLDRVVTQVGGSRREGQHAMVREVAGALGQGSHLLVQAGTGTGKTLGYLVPAVARAVRAEETVVVSTATLALQRQVLTADLPAVVKALDGHLPRAPRVALLKGWHNYVCLHKVAGGYPVDDDGGTLFALPAATTAGAGGDPERPAEGALGAQVVRVRAWAAETDTGDRDDLVPGVTDRAWRQVSVTAMECLGGSCRLRSECFPQRARESARMADVVVTNHAMLGVAAAGSPGVLPEHDVLVVDEAHELVDRVTAQATAEISASAVEQVARLARRRGGGETQDLDTAGAAVGAVLLKVPEGRLVGGLPGPLHEAVAALAAAARQVLGALKPASGTDRSGDEAAGLKVAQSAVLALFETAERMSAEDTSTDVLWVERPSPDERLTGVRLRIAPLSVSGLIRERLLAGRRAVLTSATLTIGGTFEPVARSVGLVEDDDGETWRGVDVGSPFDYRRQGILYVARSLPPPTRDGASAAQLDEIAGLVEAAGGRTLGLFSSRRAAVAAAEAMRTRLDLPVLCQGEDQLPALVRSFTEDERACLFGTLSLWQGVDVPGPTCRLVIIDRIPFPRPDDPVRSARAAAVDAAGGNGFLTVSAGHAALLLAQGAGRLIRRVDDRGVVAVLDPRLVTARYGDFLARSLPPFWRTTDGVVARAALSRLDGAPAA